MSAGAFLVPLLVGVGGYIGILALVVVLARCELAVEARRRRAGQWTS